MADKSITLSQSENSSSNGRKFRGYVTGCDTKYYDGVWTVPNSYTGIGVSIDSTYITVWNENSSTSDDVKATFTWTSSKLSTCQKTLEVIASKFICAGITVTWITIINDDSERLLLDSVTGDIKLQYYGIKGDSETSMGYAGTASFNNTKPKDDGSIKYDPASIVNIVSKCNIDDYENIKFKFNEVLLNCKFKNNITNLKVSGKIQYKLREDTWNYNDLISFGYDVTSLCSSVTIGNCNAYDNTIWKSLNDGDMLFLKHIINITYDLYPYTDYNIIFVTVINDDSDGLLKSVSGNIKLNIHSVGGTSNDIVCTNDISGTGEKTSPATIIPNKCSGVDNVEFIFDNVDLACEFSRNITNLTVSGVIKYRLGDSGSYTVLSDPVKNYTVSDITGTSAKIGECSIKDTTLWDEMDGSKPLYLQHVINISYGCPDYNIIFVTLINDNSGWLESVSGNIKLNINSVGGTSDDIVCTNDISGTDEVTSYTTTIPNKCSGVDNVKFIFNNVDLTCSFSKNIANFTVSGNIEYRLGDSGSYTVLNNNPVKNYTFSSTSNSATIGQCNFEDTTLWAKMDGSKTLYLKHVINIAYDACPDYNVIFVTVINDDSDGLLESVSGNVQLYLYSVVGSGGTSGDAVCTNDISGTGEKTSPATTIPNKCSGVDNVKFIFNNVDLTCSFSKNIANFTVSGGIEYKIGDSASYTTLSTVNNYTFSSLGSSATIGQCNFEDTTLWAKMDGSKTLYLKHVITMNYDKDEQCIPVKFSFAQSTYDIKFSGAGQTTTIILNIEDWGGVTSDNYNTWGTNGNHLSITSSTGALVIRSKTYSSSGSFSIVVTLGGNANITGDIICKDIVCSGEARCTINATYAFNVSLNYNSSDIKTLTISGSLAGSSFGLSLPQEITSTTVSPGLYNLTLTRCDLTVNAMFGGDTLGLFCNNSSVMESKVLVTDIGNISGTSFNISSNFTYSFNVTNYSLEFEIKPYYKTNRKNYV